MVVDAQVELWEVISLKATFRLRTCMRFTCLDMVRDLHVITVEEKKQAHLHADFYECAGTVHKNKMCTIHRGFVAFT